MPQRKDTHIGYPLVLAVGEDGGNYPYTCAQPDMWLKIMGMKSKKQQKTKSFGISFQKNVFSRFNK